MNQIQCQVTKSTQVLIRGRNSEVDLNSPIYAVNWFSTKVEWLYHLYNVLASKSVLKIGGRAFFKGKITQTILDEKSTARELLLIVRYPRAQNFKTLIESTYFKIVSILRIASVKDFSFGFTHKAFSNPASTSKDKLFYAVHHFQVSKVDASIFNTINVLSGTTVTIKYAGLMVADLLSKKESHDPRQVPNIMDGLVLYEAENGDDITAMFASQAYKTLIENLDSSYIGFIKRTL